ncbi:complex I assembly factor ACAD9, mitochondrial [Odontomachus brunneus]|uniref:complex I assembly factor ACAD9, mitochondrial n=1 Tax=Odontomachus brunneus TaxID=486640 RepID=UPI0013F1B430|nr:complex I assembly factor ACAD9, mitochondrial [Odontomachus brunneus]
MLARRLLCRKQLWQASCGRAVVRHTQSAVSQLQDTSNLELRLPEVLKKQPQRKPFVKNLFLGSFDYEFVYYPEPQTKARHQAFFDWLKPIENYMTECSADPTNTQRDEILSHLKDLGVFRAHVSEPYLGLGLTHTELAKLLEVLSSLSWLGSYFVKNHVMPVQLINMLGSDEQKAKYLPKIVTGEVVPTMCFTEASGFNADIQTTAEISDDDTYWLLNGEKSFVANARDANLFLVFSRCGISRETGSLSKASSVLLVESDSDGITLQDVDLVGQQGSSVCTVSFKDVRVAKSDVLGGSASTLDVMIDWMAPGNRYIAPQAVGHLKTFVKLLTTHVLQRKHLDQNMHEYEAVQEVIGKIATRLYGMESILYMTTGMMDTFDQQDCTVEKAMVEAYCANECVTCIHEGLQIIGAQSYLRENPCMQMLEDALAYTLYDSYNIDSNTYIALLGLQHTGKHMYKHVHKLRNPFMFPKFIIKWITGKEFVLRLHADEHMHPSMQTSAYLLDGCITKLAHMSIYLLETHSHEVSERQMELRRFSELATRTFALVTVLSRASRSYCIGLRNAEQDRHVANSFTILTFERVRVLADEIAAGSWKNGDRLYKNIAELMYSKKDYFAEHPLNRTY